MGNKLTLSLMPQQLDSSSLLTAFTIWAIRANQILDLSKKFNVCTLKILKIQEATQVSVISLPENLTLLIWICPRRENPSFIFLIRNANFFNFIICFYSPIYLWKGMFLQPHSSCSTQNHHLSFNLNLSAVK